MHSVDLSVEGLEKCFEVIWKFDLCFGFQTYLVPCVFAYRFAMYALLCYGLISHIVIGN